MLLTCVRLLSEWEQLNEEYESLAAKCYADATWSTKSTQLKKYLEFCNLYSEFVTSSPCPPRQVALYITHLSRTLKYSSVRGYVSALSIFLELVGGRGVDYKNHLVSTAFQGARRVLGQKVKQAAPLLPSHIVKLGEMLTEGPGHVAFRAALLLSFRALLRKQNVTDSDAMLTREDITIYKWGMMVRVRKSKTIQFQQKELLIPVTRVRDIRLCAVHWVSRHLDEVKAPKSAPLFLVPDEFGPRAQTYSDYSLTLKIACKRAGLIEKNFSSHSLRRGGTTFLGMIGVNIEEIRACGDWKSDCVYEYLKTPLDVRVEQDLKVASLLESLADTQLGSAVEW